MRCFTFVSSKPVRYVGVLVAFLFQDQGYHTMSFKNIFADLTLVHHEIQQQMMGNFSRAFVSSNHLFSVAVARTSALHRIQSTFHKDTFKGGAM